MQRLYKSSWHLVLRTAAWSKLTSILYSAFSEITQSSSVALNKLLCFLVFFSCFSRVFLVFFSLFFSCFSLCFSVVVLWFSRGFLVIVLVFLWFSCGFLVVFLWFLLNFLVFFSCFSRDFSWFSCGFLVVFLWFSCGFLVVFLWFSCGFLVVFLVLIVAFSCFSCAQIFAQFSCAFLPAGVILVNKSKILTCFFMRWASQSKLYARQNFRLQRAAVHCACPAVNAFCPSRGAWLALKLACSGYGKGVRCRDKILSPRVSCVWGTRDNQLTPIERLQSLRTSNCPV